MLCLSRTDGKSVAVFGSSNFLVRLKSSSLVSIELTVLDFETRNIVSEVSVPFSGSAEFPGFRVRYARRRNAGAILGFEADRDVSILREELLN